MRKFAFFLGLIGALSFVSFQATPAHAQGVVDSITGMFGNLFGSVGSNGNDNGGGNITDAFQNLGDQLGPQFQGIGDTFSNAFSKLG